MNNLQYPLYSEHYAQYIVRAKPPRLLAFIARLYNIDILLILRRTPYITRRRMGVGDGGSGGYSGGRWWWYGGGMVVVVV